LLAEKYGRTREAEVSLRVVLRNLIYLQPKFAFYACLELISVNFISAIKTEELTFFVDFFDFLLRQSITKSVNC
jgi:hypothetical protein